MFPLACALLLPAIIMGRGDPRCPPLPPDTVGTCIAECGSDMPCRDPLTQACCSNGCGTVCKDVCKLECPKPKPGTLGNCAELCENGCQNGTMCCSNGCGHVCMTPVRNCEHTPGTTVSTTATTKPSPVVTNPQCPKRKSRRQNGICIEECDPSPDARGARRCPNGKICCSNGCGHQCVKPIRRSSQNSKSCSSSAEDSKPGCNEAEEPCCKNTCNRRNETCVPEPKQCIKAPCPQYRCESCDETKDLCCNNTCKRCEKCVEEPKQCITTPCPQYRCERITRCA